MEPLPPGYSARMGSSPHPAQSHLTLVADAHDAPPAGAPSPMLRPMGPADPQVAGDAVPGAAGPPAHRRRRGWFELNPGCFARAALAAGAAGAASAGAGVFVAWRLWRSPPVRLARTALRVSRSARRRYVRLRSVFGR